MDGPPAAVEIRQLEELTHLVDDLRRRVAALEQRPAARPVSSPPEFTFDAPVLAAPSPANLLAALGFLLLGIAGAYLLRALTEAALVPQLAGALAGLLYAGGWLVSAARSAAANRLMAAFQALTAALIAGPLLWEATVRFHSLTPAGAAAALALFLMLGQVAAWRCDLPVVAGVTAFAGSATAVVLIIATLNPVPFAIALLIAAAVIEYGALRDRALRPRWIIAIAVDFCAFLLVYLATRPQGVPEGYAPIPIPAVIAIQIALAAIYLASTVTRTLGRGLPIAWFEIAQVTVTVALAIACGLRVAQGAGLMLMSVACMAAGACGYFAALAAKSIPPRNFHAYSTFGLVLVSFGSFLVCSSLTLAVLWSILALAATARGERLRANTLRIHGAFLLTAAAYASGLLGYTAVRMTGAWNQEYPPVTAAAMLCATASALAYSLVLRLRKAPAPAWTERVSSAILAALVCCSAVGLAAGLLIATRPDASLLSTLRTALIAAVAVALAWFGPRRNLTELIWILYPWMILGALKLLLEDFHHGRSATLFLSLLLYGGALLALPRLLRRASTARADLC